MYAEGAAELLLSKGAQRGAIRQVRRQASPLLKFVQGAVHEIRAGFCDDIDEPPGTAPELGGSAIGHHLKLFDGIQADSEWRPLAAALFPQKPILIVPATHAALVVSTLFPIY